jgi:hypothetical protein
MEPEVLDAGALLRLVPRGRPEPLQHRHINRIQLQGPQIRIELFQMILIIRNTPLVCELLEISQA